jgi:arylesterase/paraoxonase
MSASTVAAPFGNLILTGNVMDKHFLILESENILTEKSSIKE